MATFGALLDRFLGSFFFSFFFLSVAIAAQRAASRSLCPFVCSSPCGGQRVAAMSLDAAATVPVCLRACNVLLQYRSVCGVLQLMQGVSAGVT